MANFSAQNTVVRVAGSQIYANSATATATKSIEAVRALGYALSQGQATSGPVETTISLDYFIQGGTDPIKSISDTIIANPIIYANGIGAIINIGGVSISKCYLTSYSCSAEPNSLVTASASFVAYSKTQLINIGLNGAASTSAANLAFAHGAGSTTAALSNAIGFTYECSFEYEPVILLGKQGEPEAGLIYNGGTQTLNVRGIGAGDTVTYCPSSRTVGASVGTLCGGGGGLSFSITNGELTSAEANASVGGYQEGSITITKQL